jgi:hypothetical protein
MSSKDYKDWTPSDLARQLKTFGFGQYASDFRTNEIAGCHLHLITERHLKELGVKPVGHRLSLMMRFSEITKVPLDDHRPTTRGEKRMKRRDLPGYSDESSSERSEEMKPVDHKIYCQYCGRRFTPEAAKRHIPLCARIHASSEKK